ncbi:DUF111 family protein [Bacillus sp. B15-48]|nr:DUF111 family protein [Bacillus sp. B15-48]
MSILYFDCFSGISGDMVIGALIHAGANPVKMEKELKKLKIEEEYELKWRSDNKNGITGVKFDVALTENAGQTTHQHSHDHDHHHDHAHQHSHNHDHHHDHAHQHSHDHDHHHGHAHQHSHDHDHHHGHAHQHSHDHDHHHDHAHQHSHDHHHHGQRNYQEIVQLIEAADFSTSVKERALKIFKKIGEAEGRIHGIPLEKVHFHEVGAVDSIIDIIGAVLLIEQLDITSIKSSPIPVGLGKINIDHGIYPVPAPATLEILKNVPIYGGEIRGELTTPTGAAIVAVLTDEYTSIPAMQVQAVGYGAGTKTFKQHPNMLRVIIGN